MGRYDWNSDPDEIGMSGGLFGRLFPQAYAESLGAAPPQSNVGEGWLASPFSPSIPAAFGVWPSTSPFTQSGQEAAPPVYSPQPFGPNAQYRALRPALGERGAMPDPVHPGMTPIPVAQVQTGQASGNLQAPGAVPNAFSTALGDFYRHTILQAGKDIAGYATDAVQDPLGFLHAIGPSLAGIGPTLGEVPFFARGVAGESRLPAAPRGPFNLGDKSATTPVGKSGYEINVIPGTNLPAQIGGRTYIGHALDQMQARGIPPSAVEGAIQTGRSIAGNKPGRTLYTGANGVRVVTESDGSVVTVFPGGS